LKKFENHFNIDYFGKAELFPDGGSVLGSSQFSELPQLPPKTMLSLKEVKIDSKISISLC
jgi:hypothetical protein